MYKSNNPYTAHDVYELRDDEYVFQRRIPNTDFIENLSSDEEFRFVAGLARNGEEVKKSHGRHKIEVHDLASGQKKTLNFSEHILEKISQELGRVEL